MKCEKCGNEHNSLYYFATDTICKECFAKLPNDEKAVLNDRILRHSEESKFEKRAPFGKRLAATLIDIIIYAAVNIGILWYMGYFQAVSLMTEEITNAAGDPDLGQLAISNFLESQNSTLILGQLVPLLYFSLEIFIAASLGKLIMGLRITNDDETKADSGALITRYLFKNLSAFAGLIGLVAGMNFLLFNISPLILLVLLVGYFFILGKKKQAFHDMFSKTAVYKTEDLTSQEF